MIDGGAVVFIVCCFGVVDAGDAVVNACAGDVVVDAGDAAVVVYHGVGNVVVVSLVVVLCYVVVGGGSLLRNIDYSKDV